MKTRSLHLLDKFGGLLRRDKMIPIFCLLTRILGQFFNFTLQKNQMAERNVWMPKRCGSWPNFWLSLSDQPHQMFFLATASLHLRQLQLPNVHFIWDKQMDLMETKLCGFVLKYTPPIYPYSPDCFQQGASGNNQALKQKTRRVFSGDRNAANI